MVHLVNRVPKRVAGEGAPDVMHYYAGFEKIRNEARVASKTPEDAGFAGQLLGREVMEEWLAEVKERLEFDRVFEMLKKHIERQEIQRNWRVC